MKIEIVKRADGAGLLRCTRDDGSVTWQKQSERHAGHFAPHDLTHFTVETVLGLKRAFFGLIKEGWDIEDTTGKGSRGPLPQDACEAEVIVGLFDGERASGTEWSLAEMQQHAGSGASRLNDDAIAEVRKRRAELLAQWAAVPIGGVLELRF
jgi:hypothetical protein